MIVRNKATGHIQEIVGERLIPLLNNGWEPYVPERETAMLNRAIQNAAKFIKDAFRKPDALAIRR